jgi:hypothetical protein
VKALWLDAYRRVRRTSRLVADPLIGSGTLRALAELRAGRA